MGRIGSKSTGSREHVAKKTRDQGAKENNFREQGAEDFGYCIKEFDSRDFSPPPFTWLIF